MNLIQSIRNIAPELMDLIERRYTILNGINFHQPIGRRALSQSLNITERIIRSDVNILSQQGLLKIDPMGMYITDEGKRSLKELQIVYNHLKGILELQNSIHEMLGLKNIIIIPGDYNENELVIKEMGKITSDRIKNLVKDNMVIGITGGGTMASVANEMPYLDKPRDVMVIPARGGLGSELETQANAIAATMGRKLGGSYKLLNVPDTLEEDVLDMIIKNDDIKRSIDLINNINILVFGIGRADTMASRRNLSKEKIDYLMEAGAVSEAFGHYFDIDGNEIWEYKTIGLSLDKFKDTPHVIGVAGGEEKAEAIISVSSIRKDITIITDEGCARKMLTLITR